VPAEADEDGAAALFGDEGLDVGFDFFERHGCFVWYGKEDSSCVRTLVHLLNEEVEWFARRGVGRPKAS
jgi:hypothetical protein